MIKINLNIDSDIEGIDEWEGVDKELTKYGLDINIYCPDNKTILVTGYPIKEDLTIDTLKEIKLLEVNLPKKETKTIP